MSENNKTFNDLKKAVDEREWHYPLPLEGEKIEFVIKHSDGTETRRKCTVRRDEDGSWRKREDDESFKVYMKSAHPNASVREVLERYNTFEKSRGSDRDDKTRID